MAFDRAGASPLCFETTELGPNSRLSPEGFLICGNVPLARLGL
jgi:hypothetical protein